MRAELQNVTRHFRSGTDTVVALDDVSLVIPQGQFLVLIGANGSGKTTMLNILSGSVSPGTGRVLFGDSDMTGKAEHVFSRRVSRVFQDPLAGTAPALTVLENFRLASLRTQVKGFRSGLGSAFRNHLKQQLVPLRLGLENKLDQQAGLLSGGQRQALTLVMATQEKGGLLLLDEPAAALDPRTARVIMELASALVRHHGLTAVLVTHNMKDAVDYGDRLICLEEGRITRDLQAEEKMKLQVSDLHRWFER